MPGLCCAQEVDPNPENARLTAGDDESSFLTDLAGSIPGIDEAMSFAEVMRQVTALSEHTFCVMANKRAGSALSIHPAAGAGAL